MKQLWIRITGTIAALALSAALGFAAEPAKAPAKDTKAPAKAAAPAKADADKKAAPAKQEPVDINSATNDELKAVPGIGDTFATKIIVGRPYANKTQLKTRGILPEKVYEQVKDRIIAKQPKKDDKAKADPKAAAKPEPKKK